MHTAQASWLIMVQHGFPRALNAESGAESDGVQGIGRDARLCAYGAAVAGGCGWLSDGPGLMAGRLG
jgi:hypothetical protein